MNKEINRLLSLCVFNIIVIIAILWLDGLNTLSLSTIIILLLIILRALWVARKIYYFYKNEETIQETEENIK